MNIEFGELDQLEKKLKDIQENAEKLSNMEREVHTDDLFTESFVQMYSNFSSFDELLKAAGYEGQSQEEFEAFVQNDFNTFLEENSKLSGWKEFQDKAVAAYVAKQLGF
ncbi:hypothetical protein MNQ98_25180 [Paenibacillus sp. N3/727]|uniref:hypothetical protein n=1 Tax=Paenibacillus sp. N3/727 TaxID=2925845 RepID=UPI001F537DC3|nr:hypothetical protein [Paenibacillus sp. N3/727]UNK17709.1 hypothetical protein MNQ98_25180 [Paenibacillus sp. N3/727]